MEFLDGETLAERLSRGKLPEAEARAIARQICAGLAEAHRNRVVHGDLKSNNVILTRDAGGDERAVITDFGLARKPRGLAGDETATLPGGASAASQAGGTPDYMAPELWKGEKPTAASDIYALGVILYELAAGRRPYPPGNALAGPREAEACRRWGAGGTPSCRSAWTPIRRSAFKTRVKWLPPWNRRVRMRWWLAAAAAVLLAVVSGLVTFQRATAPQESLSLAMLPLEGRTGRSRTGRSCFARCGRGTGAT